MSDFAQNPSLAKWRYLSAVFMAVLAFCSCSLAIGPVDPGNPSPDPSSNPNPDPGPVPPSTVVYVGDGGTTMILEPDGTLWGTGLNAAGELGDGTTVARNTFTQLMTGVKQTSLGKYAAMFVKMDGTLWVVGVNQGGRLGTGNGDNVAAPVQIMENVASASIGAGHSMVVKTDNTLWTMGTNYNGEMGSTNTGSIYTPVQIMSNVRYAEAGYLTTLILKTDGTLWGLGNNQYGQLGLGSGVTYTTSAQQIMSGVTSVSSPRDAYGAWYALVLKTDGSLWAFGVNTIGNLGDGTTVNRYIPVHITDDVRFVHAGMVQAQIIKTDDSLWVTGRWFSTTGPGTIIGNGIVQTESPRRVAENVESASSGYDSTTYVKKDGTIWAVGRNEYGQFGDGTNTSSIEPVQVYLP